MAISFDFDDLTNAEKDAIKQIDKAMKTLSKRHWFYSASCNFNIMRYGEDGDHSHDSRYAGMDQDMIAASVNGYDIDGGDW